MPISYQVRPATRRDVLRHQGFDLFILDCDGVLVDSERLAIRAMQAVLNEAGVPASEDLVLGCFGMKQSDALDRIAAATGCPIPPGVPARLWPATRRSFAQALQPMAGVAAVLDCMPAWRRCVASSSHPERIRVSLALTGLDVFFGDACFSSSEVAHGKPAPDLFLLAATRMGASPERCAVVEDSIYGIEAARAAGMTPFGFAGGSHVGPVHAEVLRAAGAVAVERSWADLAPWLLG
jgi:HAD superfamily hydrolase (TIGR01509 family)